MRLISYISFIFLARICSSDTQIINLNEIKGNQQINGIENGANLFLASNDKAVRLAQIKLTSGSNTITLNQLPALVNDDGSQKPWVLSSNLTIANSNSDDSTSTLNGFLYITTASQAKDPNFSVHVIRDNITLTTPQNANSTSVILNLKQTDKSIPNEPDFYSQVGISSQAKDAKLKIYYSNPIETYLNLTSTDNYKIFENPLAADPTNIIFFDHIETFQIPGAVWYFYTTGEIEMTINRRWDDNTVINTTSVTTTGLITNGLKTIQNSVNFVIDPTHNRTSGFAINAILTTNMTVSLISDTGIVSANFEKSDYPNIVTAESEMSATKLVVTPYGDTAGEYYIQYFGKDGISLPTTVSTSTASTPKITTSDPSTTTTNACKETSFLITLSLIFAYCFKDTLLN